MHTVTIRPIKRGDGKIFLSLIDALADFEKLKRPTKVARSRLLRDGLGKCKRFDAFLAFAGGKPAGYAIIFETYSSFRALPTLYLEDIFVLPQYRKHGIGHVLFQKCLAEAKHRGCGRMEWIVLNWNKGAIKFYRKVNAQYMKQWRLYRIEF